jgi:HSP20 family protein
MQADRSCAARPQQFFPLAGKIFPRLLTAAKTAIPGVDPQDIEVQMDRGLLTIKGQRTVESSSGGDNGRFSRIERLHGLFHRRFALPDSTDPEGIQAHGRNGVLEVVIPKRPESKPRRIRVGATL